MSRTNFSAETPEPGAKAAGGLLTDLRGSGADAGAADAAPPATPRRKVSTQTLVLILVLAASSASLYTMRKQGMAAGIVFQPVKLDYEPDKTRAEDAKAQARIMAELARSVAGGVFNDEPLHKNPFKMDAGAPAVAAALPQGPDAAQVALTQRAEDIRTHLAALALNGVMMGPTPLARIAGKTYTVSDTIDGIFLVTEIRDRSVDLMADQKIYTLQMSDTSTPGGRRNPAMQPVPGRR